LIYEGKDKGYWEFKEENKKEKGIHKKWKQ